MCNIWRLFRCKKKILTSHITTIADWNCIHSLSARLRMSEHAVGRSGWRDSDPHRGRRKGCIPEHRSDGVIIPNHSRSIAENFFAANRHIMYMKPKYQGRAHGVVVGGEGGVSYPSLPLVYFCHIKYTIQRWMSLRRGLRIVKNTYPPFSKKLLRINKYVRFFKTALRSHRAKVPALYRSAVVVYKCDASLPRVWCIGIYI